MGTSWRNTDGKTGAYAARAAFVLSVALLGLGLLLLGLTWATAVRESAVPASLGQSSGNHGLWHGHGPEAFLLEFSDLALLGAGCAALLAWALRRSKRLLALALLCFALLVTSFWVHFWLVD